MVNQKGFIGWVLLFNGIIDLICVGVLLILPSIRQPIMGYQVFDSQGAFMAGGWGMATLVLGIIRIWSASKPVHFAAMKLLGLLEGASLAAYTLVCLAVGRATIVQALLPLFVGLVFGLLYFVSFLQKAES